MCKKLFRGRRSDNRSIAAADGEIKAIGASEESEAADGLEDGEAADIEIIPNDSVEMVPAGQEVIDITDSVKGSDKRRKKKDKSARKRTLGVKKGLSAAQKAVLIAAAVLLVFAAAGVIMYYSSGASKSVNVVCAESFLQDAEYMYTGDSSYGLVKAENMQAQYVSYSQRVNKIYVKEGDKVKAGDLIMSYDTTLDSLEVDKKALKVSEMELELVNLKRQLATINSMKPSNPNANSSSTTEEPPETPTGEVVLNYKKLEGEGTRDDPYIYILAGSDIPCDDEFLNVLFAESSEVWVVFENRTSNMTGGRVRQAWGVQFSKSDSGASFHFFDASGYIYHPEPGEPEEDPGSGYTAAEIAQMRRETQQSITEKDLEVRMARVEVAQMRLELSGGEVYSKIDGVVTQVRTEDEARDEDLPILLISGGGGFYVTASISELMLDSVSVGDEAVITSYETGMTYDGKVTDILDMPVTDEYYYYSDGASASYYPVTVLVDESANLREDEYVSVNFDASTKNAKYLESMFILSENGSSYIYVRGEDGLLEKRRITTGGTLYGYLTQVTGGISPEDYIAFPYGRNVRAGARTNECTLDEFYGQMY